MTKAGIIAEATAKAPSIEAENVTSLVGVSRADLLAALEGQANDRASALRQGATNADPRSILYCQREHLLEALADESA